MNLWCKLSTDVILAEASALGIIVSLSTSLSVFYVSQLNYLPGIIVKSDIQIYKNNQAEGKTRRSLLPMYTCMCFFFG